MANYPSRKALRLKHFDYAEDGFYFLTICTKDRKELLSEISVTAGLVADLRLTPYGEIAESYIKSVSGIEKYVIMPNHVHMIIHKTNGKSLSSDVRSFKGLVTKRIGENIWQASYYDHVIRNETDYLEKWQYIDHNPAKWTEDEYHP